jgi:hypothetical protein
MTEDRHEAEARTTPQGRRGPIVAGTEAHEDEKPVRVKETEAAAPPKDRRGPIVAGTEAHEVEKPGRDKSDGGPS